MSERNFKEEAEIFCSEVEDFSENKLHNREDLQRITELIFKKEDEKFLEDFTFTAKYLQGLIRIIKKTDRDFEKDYFEKIKAEYTANINKIRNVLQELLGDASPFIKEIYNEKFLSMNHQSLHNLNMLIDDLSWVKLYLNDRKRQ